MATSRTSIPAVPTSVGTTDDAALGGIFSRSNLANPVSGVDVNGVAINNATITIDINGDAQSFTLNQSTDTTLTYTVAGGGGGSTSDPNAFTNASITGNVITLTRGNGVTQDITIPQSTGNPLTALAWNDSSNTFTATLTDGTTINSEPITGFLTGVIVGSTPVTPNAAGVVTIPQPSSTINIQASGQADNSTTELNVDTSAIRIAGTDYHLTYNTTTNTIAFSSTAVPPPTPPASATENFTAPAGNALSAPTPPSNTITPASGTTINTVTSTITGNINGTPISVGGTVTSGGNPIPMGGTTNPVDITFPPSSNTNAGENYSNPGTYTVTTTTTAVNADGDSNTITNRDTFTRFYPYFQLRTNPADGSAITGGIASTAMWLDRGDGNNNFTAIAGSGSLYIAAPANDLTGSYTVRLDNAATGFRLNNRRVGTSSIPVTIAGTTPAATVAYNVYQVAGVAAGSNLFFIPS